MATFRPISSWPGSRTRDPRPSPFRAAYSDTLGLLDQELQHLDARRVVIEMDLDESQIRLDGLPRAGARPATPGVVVSFESRHGPLRYACDRFTGWQDNLRAIALGLESLRRVERYGIATSGEQYAGWKALPAANGQRFTSAHDARHWLAELAGTITSEDVDAGRVSDRQIIAAALKRAHPDGGGDADLFRDAQAARKVLEGTAA